MKKEEELQHLAADEVQFVTQSNPYTRRSPVLFFLYPHSTLHNNDLYAAWESMAKTAKSLARYRKERDGLVEEVDTLSAELDDDRAEMVRQLEASLPRGREVRASEVARAVQSPHFRSMRTKITTSKSRLASLRVMLKAREDLISAFLTQKAFALQVIEELGVRAEAANELVDTSTTLLRTSERALKAAALKQRASAVAVARLSHRSEALGTSQAVGSLAAVEDPLAEDSFVTELVRAVAAMRDSSDSVPEFSHARHSHLLHSVHLDLA